MMSQSIITPNRMKLTLREGKSVIGTMVTEIRQPAIMQLLANAGFDFVIIDNEHGAFNIETIADLSRTAVYLGLTPIVRIPDLTYPYVAQTLDAGAQGIMVPRISNVQQVKDIVQMMKYPPVGIRGSALIRGYTRFLSGSVAEVMATCNEETMLIVQIETLGALEAMEEIVATPGVDATFIGPNDLSIALGVPGQMDHPDLNAAIEAMISACRRHNVFPALQMNDLKLAAQWAAKGMRIVSSSSETGLLMKAGLEVTTTIKKSFAAPES
jgi:2-dehydro-3-deoxyglucarate aldolase/4-hydroxy-2-oxoheptanedioate aldolase